MIYSTIISDILTDSPLSSGIYVDSANHLNVINCYFNNIAGSGITILGTPGLKLRAQWSGATLVKLAANTWVVMGDLKA